MIIFFLPIVDLMFSSFSATPWPLFTVYGTFWYLLNNFPAWAILPQIWLLKILYINYLEIFVITGLELLAFCIKQNFFNKWPAFFLFSIIYYLIHIYNYGANLIALGILFLIVAIIWYTEIKGKLGNRFV
jgi:hypothetical protein